MTPVPNATQVTGEICDAGTVALATTAPRQIVEVQDVVDAAMSIEKIVAQAALIQQAMKAVMKVGEHYGTIPGCGDRMVLFKSGAEKLLFLFRISPEVHVEDLSTPDTIRYRVTSRAVHITSGAYLGSGVGECSSDEDKYRWRDIVIKEEWEATPPDQRREKFSRNRNKDGTPIVSKQIRRNPADLANTVLKMAKKRAMVDMTLSVTSASDIFAQDLEDMESAGAPSPSAATSQQPIPPPPPPPPPHPAELIWALGYFASILGIDRIAFFDTVEQSYGTRDLHALTMDQLIELGTRLKAAISAGSGDPPKRDGEVVPAADGSVPDAANTTDSTESTTNDTSETQPQPTEPQSQTTEEATPQ